MRHRLKEVPKSRRKFSHADKKMLYGVLLADPIAAQNNFSFDFYKST